MSGASGFIGKPLFHHFQKQGHQVVRLVREKTTDEDAIQWDPDRGIVVKELFEDFDAVIHLAGENLYHHRWTRSVRKQILLSRTISTWLLSQILSQLYRPPKVFLSPSMINFYGDRGEDELDEESSEGSGFLSQVCFEWEKASYAIEARGCRTVHPRIGFVIGNGGIFQRMQRQCKLGLGTVFGSGTQWMSWVGMNDVIRALEFAIQTDRMEGVFNLVSPQPARQKEFITQLAAHLKRPVFLSEPSWVLKMRYGEIAKETLLSSLKVFPQKLMQAGFTFQHPSLDSALKVILDCT